MFVLDEADEMLSRGFKDQIYDIFQLLPPKLQVSQPLAWSASHPGWVLFLQWPCLQSWVWVWAGV